MSTPWQGGSSALLGPQVPATTLEKYSLLLVSHGEISQCSQLSLGSSSVSPSGNLERRHDSSEGTVLKCLSYFSNMSVNLCTGDRSKKFMSCQPEIPKMEELWHRAIYTHTCTRTVQKAFRNGNIWESWQCKLWRTLGLDRPDMWMSDTGELQAAGLNCSVDSCRTQFTSLTLTDADLSIVVLLLSKGTKGLSVKGTVTRISARNNKTAFISSLLSSLENGKVTAQNSSAELLIIVKEVPRSNSMVLENLLQWTPPGGKVTGKAVAVVMGITVYLEPTSINEWPLVNQGKGLWQTLIFRAMMFLQQSHFSFFIFPARWLCRGVLLILYFRFSGWMWCSFLPLSLWVPVQP